MLNTTPGQPKTVISISIEIVYADDAPLGLDDNNTAVIGDRIIALLEQQRQHGWITDRAMSITAECVMQRDQEAGKE